MSNALLRTPAVVLLAVGTADPKTTTAIRERTGVYRGDPLAESTLYTQCSRLVEDGLLNKTPGHAGKRQSRYELSDDGRKRLAALRDACTEALQ